MRRETPWHSGTIVASFVVAGVSWVVFVSWEAVLTSGFAKITTPPILSTRLLTRRVVAGALWQYLDSNAERPISDPAS